MSMKFSDSKCSDEATANLNWDHTEYGLKLGGVTTMTTPPAYNRAKLGHSAKPDVNPELCKNMIEIPHGWTNVIYPWLPLSRPRGPTDRN